MNPATRLPRKGRLFLPALLLLIYVGQCAWFIGTQSLAFDEPYHIVAGLDAWRHGRFERWNDHPPLARLLFTLPIARGEWNVELSDTSRATAITPDPLALTWRVRAVNVLLGLGLAILLWSVTRRLFSPGAANFALPDLPRLRELIRAYRARYGVEAQA